MDQVKTIKIPFFWHKSFENVLNVKVGNMTKASNSDPNHSEVEVVRYPGKV